MASRLVATSDRVREQALDAFPNIRFASASCWIAWLLLMFSGELFAENIDVHAYDTFSYTVSTVTVSSALFLMGMRNMAAWRMIHRFRTIAVASFAVVVGTAVTILATYHAAMTPLGLVGNVLTGAGTAVIGLRCSLYFAEISPRRCFASAAWSLALALLVYSTVLTFPLVVVRAATIVLPLIALVPFLLDENADSSAHADGSCTLPWEFWRFIGAIFLLAVAFSITRGLYPNEIRIDEFNLSRGIVSLGIIAVCGVLVIVAVLSRRDFSFGRLGYWVIVITVFAFAFIPMLGLSSTVTGVVFSIANGALGVVTWSLLGCVSSQSGISAIRVYGIGFGAFMMGSPLGWLAGYAVDHFSMRTATDYMGFAIIVMVGVAMLVLFRQEDLLALVNHADDERDEEEASRAEAERNRLEATAQGEEGGREHEAARIPDTPASQDGAGQHRDHSALSESEHSETTAEVERQTAYGGRARWRMAVMRLGEDHGLSDREIEVLMLMGKGLNTRSISEVLSISYNTARTHVRNIYGKLGVHSRVELQQLIDGLRPQPGEQPEGE